MVSRCKNTFMGLLTKASLNNNVHKLSLSSLVLTVQVLRKPSSNCSSRSIRIMPWIGWLESSTEGSLDVIRDSIVAIFVCNESKNSSWIYGSRLGNKETSSRKGWATYIRTLKSSPARRKHSGKARSVEESCSSSVMHFNPLFMNYNLVNNSLELYLIHTFPATAFSTPRAISPT